MKMSCSFTKTHDGLDLDLLVFMSGEVQQQIQHFVLDDDLGGHVGETQLKRVRMEAAATRPELGAGTFTLLAPLNSSWSKSKCRQRAPTVKSERSSVGLLVASVELFGSSWCWVFSLARAPGKNTGKGADEYTTSMRRQKK